jgi:hypothetical protein
MLAATGGVLAIAPQLDLVTRLFAVLAAVLAESSARLDGALTRRMRAFR